MAKIPSSKFSTAKKKIPSSTFSKAKRKISSGTFSNPTAKIPSRKLATAKKTTKQNQDVNAPAPLGRPSDEQARQEVIATLKNRTVALKKTAKKSGC